MSTEAVEIRGVATCGWYNLEEALRLYVVSQQGSAVQLYLTAHVGKDVSNAASPAPWALTQVASRMKKLKTTAKRRHGSEAIIRRGSAQTSQSNSSSVREQRVQIYSTFRVRAPKRKLETRSHAQCMRNSPGRTDNLDKVWICNEGSMVGPYTV